MVDKLNLVARSAWVMEELLEFEIELKLILVSVNILSVNLSLVLHVF